MSETEPILLFPRIDLDQAERLTALVDSFGEAQQAVGRIVTHGFAGRAAEGSSRTNRQMLEESIRRLNAAVAELAARGDIDPACLDAPRRPV